MIDSPSPGTLVHAPEIDVRGHFRSYDGRAWVYAESTTAEVGGSSFVARRVPLRAGKMELAVELSDGRGRKSRVTLPLTVESPDRPRSDRLCRAGQGCLRYETRGVPRRDGKGRIVNAIVVLSAFGFDERLDQLWPDLVGPGRALDSQRSYVIGVAGGADEAGRLPGPEAVLALLEALVDTLDLDPGAALIGASSYGVELALRVIADPHAKLATGPVLLCGGHDRPFEEPPLVRVREVLRRARATGQAPLSTWRQIAEAMVAASYTPAYLRDARHAVEHGLVDEVARVGLSAALVERQARYFLDRLAPAELERRMEAAFSLEGRPLTYPSLHGRRIVLVANRDDQMVSLSRIEALRTRLGSAGASVALRVLGDELGHSAFFRHAPVELERAVEELLVPAGAQQ